MKQFLDDIADKWRPHAGQRRFLLSRAPLKVLACGRRWGKTEVCAADVAATLQLETPTRWLMVAPTLVQARLLFDRVLAFLHRLGRNVDARSSPYPHFQFLNHVVAARSGHRPDSLRGDEATHVVVDEAAFVSGALVDDILAPMLATTNGRMSLVSTPNGFNHFWKRFLAGGRRGVWSGRGPSGENPHVSKRFLKSQAASVSDRTYRTEYEAEFVDAAGVLIRNDLIELAICQPVDDAPSGSISAGVDWAKSRDHTTVAIVRGWGKQKVVVSAERLPRGDYGAMIGSVARRIEESGATSVAADCTGLGDNPTSLLAQRLRVPVIPYSFNVSSKGVLIERLVAAFELSEIRMARNQALIDELRSFRAEVLPGGGVRYAAAGSGHDDLVIALALALYAQPYSDTLRSRF